MNSKVETSQKTNIDKLIYLFKSKDFKSALNLSDKLLEIYRDNTFLLNFT